MTDYQKYINALRKCAKEHEGDRTFTGQIIVSDLCQDTANLLETIEKEPTTKNNLGVDCVARQDVERFIEGFINEYTPEEELEFINLELDGLKHLPPATPQEPKTGKWISTETKGVRYAFWCRYKCPLCGGLSDHTNFCPNCGAKMESEDKE